MAEALERETWSLDRWKAWQEEQLAYVLHRAATQVPYYREQWSKRRANGDRSLWEYLENWPILQQDALRENPKAFLVEGVRPTSLFELHTSGTTGKPLKLWRGRRTNTRWYALNEARLKWWNGIVQSDRWAILGGQLVTPFRQERPPFWVWNAGIRQLYMSSYHLAPQNAPAYCEAMNKYNVQYLIGYASSLHSLAMVVLEKGIKVSNLKVAISNAEPLFEHQRSVIEMAFGCPVRDTYGMAEIVAAASECSKGKMHLWPDVGAMEIVNWEEDRPTENGESGRLVCTGLINAEMPLIRYEIGDSGALAPESVRCACGRNLPILKNIEGRQDDMILTPDGRRIGRFDPVFKADLAIREAQIIQEDFDTIRVKLVPAPGYKKEDGLRIAQRLRDRVGNLNVIQELVGKIPRNANGKFKAVVSHISVVEGKNAGSQ
jgi:phenylacetate-CoA ligase